MPKKVIVEGKKYDNPQEIFVGELKCPGCGHREVWQDWWWPRIYCNCGKTDQPMEIVSKEPLAESGKKICGRCHQAFTPSRFTPYQKYCEKCGAKPKAKPKAEPGPEAKVTAKPKAAKKAQPKSKK